VRLSDLKTDVAASEEGDWVDEIPNLGDISLKVRGLNNKDFRKLQQRLMGSVPRSKRVKGRMAIEEQDRIMSECLLKTILVDWRGLAEDEAGKVPIPYSEEKARELLFGEEYAVFREGVVWAASLIADRRQGEHEDKAKN
jgi:hypothetical protein